MDGLSQIICFQVEILLILLILFKVKTEKVIKYNGFLCYHIKNEVLIMIIRPSYIDKISPFIDQPLVKILSGVRRCGKSTLFEMLREELIQRGVKQDHIIMKRYSEIDIPDDISAKKY